jgi:hypothetical protein
VRNEWLSLLERRKEEAGKEGGERLSVLSSYGRGSLAAGLSG